MPFRNNPQLQAVSSQEHAAHHRRRSSIAALFTSVSASPGIGARDIQDVSVYGSTLNSLQLQQYERTGQTPLGNDGRRPSCGSLGSQSSSRSSSRKSSMSLSLNLGAVAAGGGAAAAAGLAAILPSALTAALASLSPTNGTFATAQTASGSGSGSGSGTGSGASSTAVSPNTSPATSPRNSTFGTQLSPRKSNHAHKSTASSSGFARSRNRSGSTTSSTSRRHSRGSSLTTIPQEDLLDLNFRLGDNIIAVPPPTSPLAATTVGTGFGSRMGRFKDYDTNGYTNGFYEFDDDQEFDDEKEEVARSKRQRRQRDRSGSIAALKAYRFGVRQPPPQYSQTKPYISRLLESWSRYVQSFLPLSNQSISYGHTHTPSPSRRFPKLPRQPLPPRALTRSRVPFALPRLRLSRLRTAVLALLMLIFLSSYVVMHSPMHDQRYEHMHPNVGYVGRAREAMGRMKDWSLGVGMATEGGFGGESPQRAGEPHLAHGHGLGRGRGGRGPKHGHKYRPANTITPDPGANIDSDSDAPLNPFPIHSPLHPNFKLRLTREQELGCLTAFMAAHPDNALPMEVIESDWDDVDVDEGLTLDTSPDTEEGAIKPELDEAQKRERRIERFSSQPLDPQLILDFDPSVPGAEDEVDEVVRDVWERNPVVLFSKFHSALSREVKNYLRELEVWPRERVFEVDLRADATLLVPTLLRLTNAEQLPILLIGSKPISSMNEIRQMFISGELRARVRAAGAEVGVGRGGKKKKKVNNGKKEKRELDEQSEPESIENQ